MSEKIAKPDKSHFDNVVQYLDALTLYHLQGIDRHREKIKGIRSELKDLKKSLNDVIDRANIRHAEANI